MGNSPSSRSRDFDPSVPISKPVRSQSGVARRASAAPRATQRTRDDATLAGGSRSNNLLAPPSTHRRTRSASATTAYAAPPPPYSEAARLSAVDVAASGNQPPPSTPVTAPSAQSPGSRHTNVFVTPNAPASSGTAAARPAGRSNTYLRAPMRQDTAENALETLRKYNTVLIVDDSRSMSGPLWNEARDALAALAGIAGKYDADGIDVYFLNAKQVGRNMKSSQEVEQLFNTIRPRGITPIAERLEDLLLEYLADIERAKRSGDPAVFKAIKPVNYIILTDGAPTDDPEAVIVAAAKRLDAGNFPMSQVGIQFVQIGNSRDATEYLQELDDGLARNHGVRDIVDTTPYTGGQLTADMLTKILLGGINRRVDHRGSES